MFSLFSILILASRFAEATARIIIEMIIATTSIAPFWGTNAKIIAETIDNM